MKVFGIAGCSGTGKTTLMEKVIPHLTDRGLKVSVIKHAHHGFDIDRPGKDSFRHRQAGAGEVLISCGSRWALMHELRDEAEPALEELLRHLAPCDLVLVEGYKSEPIPKLEVLRPASGKPPLYPDRDDIVALATDVEVDTGLPCLDLNDAVAVAAFIVDFCEFGSPS